MGVSGKYAGNVSIAFDGSGRETSDTLRDTMFRMTRKSTDLHDSEGMMENRETN